MRTRLQQLTFKSCHRFGVLNSVSLVESTSSKAHWAKCYANKVPLGATKIVYFETLLSLPPREYVSQNIRLNNLNQPCEESAWKFPLLRKLRPNTFSYKFLEKFVFRLRLS